MRFVFRFAIMLLLWLPLPAPAATGPTAAQMQTTRTLAKPVLTQGASDAALVAHLRALHEQSAGSDIMALVFMMMKEALEEQMEDLKYWAEKVKHHNDMQKALRDYMHELHRAAGELNSHARTATVRHSALGRIDAALRRFEAALRRARGLPPGDQRALNAIVVRERHFIRASRHLISQAEAIARTPRRATHRAPLPPRPPTQQRPAPATGTLRMPPR